MPSIQVFRHCLKESGDRCSSGAWAGKCSICVVEKNLGSRTHAFSLLVDMCHGADRYNTITQQSTQPVGVFLCHRLIFNKSAVNIITRASGASGTPVFPRTLILLPNNTITKFSTCLSRQDFWISCGQFPGGETFFIKLPYGIVIPRASKVVYLDPFPRWSLQASAHSTSMLPHQILESQSPFAKL
ncbi:hypothetical protein BD779DRAFT_693700 [Infundibulicybe gibba]|nr:hypothetical protein BD779DRAFT_693700 [Infundibulicybe gibba]